MPQKYIPVPKKSAAHSDDAACYLLGISRTTFFRKLRDGTLSPPPPISGTKRRWWDTGSILLAKEELKGAA
jgi:predicted DNA-binding transcriptional regulator AlpA